MKGGTGKSTVAFNLSIWVATRRNVHVSVYDLDPQATITDALEIRTEDGHVPTIIPSHDVNEISEEGEHTEVINDIGISDSKAMNAAIAKADRILIPVAPSQADVWSTQRFIRFVSSIVSARKNSPEVCTFINRVDMQSAANESYETAAALVSLPGARFLLPRLSQRPVFLHSFSEGLAAMELDPRDPGVREFNALAAELYPHLIR